MHNRRDTYTLNEKLEQRNPVVAPINKLNLLWGFTLNCRWKGLCKKQKIRVITCIRWRTELSACETKLMGYYYTHFELMITKNKYHGVIFNQKVIIYSVQSRPCRSRMKGDFHVRFWTRGVRLVTVPRLGQNRQIKI